MAAERSINVLTALQGNLEFGRACDSLMSSLGLMNGPRRLRRLIVTSALPGEGKTTIATCLAARLAAAGDRALIIDADLRRPRVHSLLGVSGTPGLIDLLTDQVPSAAATRQISLDGIAKGQGGALDVIPSGKGTRHALSLLRSPAAAQKLEQLTAPYDVVVIDSPPVLAVSDSLWLVRHVDGVVLVLHTGSTTMRAAEGAKNRIAEAGGHIVGTVLNRFDQKLHGMGFYPYGSYYDVEQERVPRERRAHKR
jgi:capsular exopolysaccharide synthesis family protein